MSQNMHVEEVRWHGRGGQGAVLGASILGSAAALYEGRYATSFPSFGAERRGAPVQAFTRIAGRAIRTRCQIYHPTKVIVLDDTLLGVVDITAGVPDGASILVNTRKSVPELSLPASLNVVVLDASAIAREIIGVAIVNTTMLGALIKITGVVKRESAHAPLEKRFGRLGERNIKAMETAYEDVLIEEQP